MEGGEEEEEEGEEEEEEEEENRQTSSDCLSVQQIGRLWKEQYRERNRGREGEHRKREQSDRHVGR